MKVFIGFLAGVLSTVTMVIGFIVGGAFGYMIGQDTPKRTYSYVPSKGMRRYGNFLEPEPQKIKWKDLDDSKFNRLFPDDADDETDKEEV